MTKNYDDFRAGMLRAAEMCRNEFKRAPEAAKDHDCVYMGGYEDACDHLSVAIAQAAVIDSVRIAGARPDWQYHISLLLPDGIEDETLLRIYQIVEHELRAPPERTPVAGEQEHCGQLMRYEVIKDGDTFDGQQLIGTYYCERCSTMKPIYTTVATTSDSARRAAEEIAKYLDAFTPLSPGDDLIRIFENTIKRNFAAAPADNDAEARRLLTECCYTIQQLAEQQAMPDSFYERTLQAVGRFLEPAATTKGDR